MKRQVGNLRDLAVKLPLRDAFVLSQLGKGNTTKCDLFT